MRAQAAALRDSLGSSCFNEATASEPWIFILGSFQLRGLKHSEAAQMALIQRIGLHALLENLTARHSRSQRDRPYAPVGLEPVSTSTLNGAPASAT
jgi:hypothetical protein